MNTKFIQKLPVSTKKVVIPILETATQKQITVIFPTKVESQLKALIKNNKDLGKKEKISKYTVNNGKNNIDILIVGLGKKSEIKPLKVKKIAGTVVDKVGKSKDVVVCSIAGQPELTRLFFVGFYMRNYQFPKYLDKKDLKSIETINFLDQDKQIKAAERKELEVILQSTNLVRNLVNTPANELYPEELTRTAKKIAKKAGRHMKVEAFGDKKLAKMGANLILAVGSGSDKESQMIIMEYKHPKAKNKQPILVAGKGITFDAGGLNIKPTGHIETMKMDMGGAANVLGLMDIIAQLQPEIYLIGAIGSAENMTGGSAMRPGDIYKAYNGKTVEITNTDAEGRLVLADTLAYTTKKYKPNYVLDMATLTGACIVALGHETTGIVSNNDKLSQKVQTAAAQTQEPIWQLPLTDKMRGDVKGHISDYYNWTAKVMAGASMAAAFLEKFINDYPWCHFDIAGSSWNDGETELSRMGSTGVPLQTIWETVKTPFTD